MKSKAIRLISALALFGTLAACGTEDLISDVFPPTISAVTPNAGHVGDTVTISGTFLSENGSAHTVTFNGIAANATPINDVAISAVVPVGATTGPVVVTNPNNGSPLVSNSVTFTVN